MRPVLHSGNLLKTKQTPPRAGFTSITGTTIGRGNAASGLINTAGEENRSTLTGDRHVSNGVIPRYIAWSMRIQRKCHILPKSRRKYGPSRQLSTKLRLSVTGTNDIYFITRYRTGV